MVGLMIILILVLILPFTLKIVERHLEIFLFVMGIFAAKLSGVLHVGLIKKALQDPLTISLAVIVAGLMFRCFQKPTETIVRRASERIPLPFFLAFIVIFLGLISSVITAIIAAIILVTIVSILPLDRTSQIRFVIIACYSIGLGAVLTPLGEPLSTIATSKLNADFFYLFRLIGHDILVAVLCLGLLTILCVHPEREEYEVSNRKLKIESVYELFLRGIKVYVFVMALTFLGAGFEPFIEVYLLDLSANVLYWINIVSAVLDNATLAAAEVSPAMDPMTIRSILLGLLISGGMLIPGNIPNIIAASKLKMTSLEWARFGVPLGMVTMCIYYFIVF